MSMRLDFECNKKPSTTLRSLSILFKLDLFGKMAEFLFEDTGGLGILNTYSRTYEAAFIPMTVPIDTVVISSFPAASCCYNRDQHQLAPYRNQKDKCKKDLQNSNRYTDVFQKLILNTLCLLQDNN